MFYLVKEFDLAGVFIECIARYHVTQHFCSEIINLKCLKKRLYWKYADVRELIKLQILFSPFLVIALRKVTVG
jgi:hypothetical protein